MAELTPSQTVGPWFSYGLTPRGEYDFTDLASNNLVTADVTGDRVAITGRVTDGDGAPIHDAMIEIWQADAQGRYAHPRDGKATPNASFKGFGRCHTDKDGIFKFETIKPGPVEGIGGKPQAPHILLALFARGLLTHLYTRVYFAGEAANESDAVLAAVPAERRATLIAPREGNVYRFDIRIQGENETVFFAY